MCPPLDTILCHLWFQTPHFQILIQTFLPGLPSPSSTTLSLHLKFSAGSCRSFLFIRSKCPNHRNLLLLTTSVTHSIPKSEIISSLFFLHEKLTPHILLTIALSVRNSLLASS